MSLGAAFSGAGLAAPASGTGDFVAGVLALGVLAPGVLALGVLAVGALAVGVLAAGVLAALGRSRRLAAWRKISRKLPSAFCLTPHTCHVDSLLIACPSAVENSLDVR